jgi:hypothetical protein
MPTDYAFSSRIESEDVWATFPGGWVRTHHEQREELYTPKADEFPGGAVGVLSSKRVTSAHFLDGSSTVLEDDWKNGDPWAFKGKPWVGETRFFKNVSGGSFTS